jgi:hypothetical protein
LLAAAFAAPAAAQEGGVQPERRMAIPAQIQQAVPEAPMPRAKADDVAIEIELSFSDLKVKVQEAQTGSFAVAPAPVMPQPTPPAVAPPAMTDQRQLFNFYAGIFDSNEPVMPQPQAPRIVVPPLGPCPACMTGGQNYKPAVVPSACPQFVADAGVIRVIAVDACPPCPFPQVAPNPLIGTWYRDLGVGVIAVTFTHAEMKVAASQCEDGSVITLKLTAHYMVTKDGLVYGAVTSADVDVKSDPKSESKIGMELAEMSLALQGLTESPFSFRAKMTSAGLMISQLKASSPEGMSGKELAIFGGLYKSAKDGKVPAPTPVKTESGPKASSYTAPPALPLDTPLPPPPPRYTATVGPDGLQRVGVDFQYSVPQMLPPVPCDRGVGAAVGTVACPLPAPRPACNDAMKSMAAEAFGQMLWSTGGALPTSPVPCVPQCGQGTVPAGTPIGSYVVLPAGATPMPLKNATPACASARAAHTGTWFREIGSKHCVVKIEADHLTITLSEAQELDGKTMTGHLTFTADYSITRDGMTAVGLITNVDVKCDGDMPEDDMRGMMEQIREMQKALEEKPFAMTFRRYGETLVIGNVRLPEVGNGMENPPASYIGGRYKEVGDKPLPKLKAVKACEPRPLPAYGPPPGAFPGAYGPGIYGPPCPPPPGAYGSPLPVPCPGPYGLPPGAFNGPALLPTYPGPLSVAIPFAPGSGLPPTGLPPIPCPVPAQPLTTPAGGELLPPQSLPTPTRPAEFVTPAVRPTRPAEAPAEPTMSEPVAPVPTMPEPIPPAVSANEEPKPVAAEMAVAWRNKVQQLPNPTHNGAPGACLVGQLFLYGGPNLQFTPADGTLTVDLVDETPRPYGQAAAKSERWQLDKESLRKLVTTDETFGKSYTLALPWAGYSSDVTRVRVSVRYDAANGQTLYVAPRVVTLTQEVGSILRALESQKPQRQLFSFTGGVFGSQ